MLDVQLIDPAALTHVTGGGGAANGSWVDQGMQLWSDRSVQVLKQVVSVAVTALGHGPGVAVPSVPWMPLILSHGDPIAED